MAEHKRHQGHRQRMRERVQHPDIYEQYVTVSESRRFYVKKQREEAA